MSLTLSIIATTLAVLSFLGAIWRLWRDRPRLNFYVHKAHVRDMKNLISEMMEVRVCNIGFRPIILTKCIFFGEKSAFHMGIDDEPDAAYGVANQRFPSILNPGTTHIFHPISIGSLERNCTDPKDKKIFFDPYLYMVIVDSFGRFHHVSMNEIRHSLGIAKVYRHPSLREKCIETMHRTAFFYRARRRLRVL